MIRQMASRVGHFGDVVYEWPKQGRSRTSKNTEKSTKIKADTGIWVGPAPRSGSMRRLAWPHESTYTAVLCSCRHVFNKMEIFWHFQENFEVRYLEKVYNFSAILLQ